MNLNYKKVMMYTLVFIASIFLFTNNVVAATDWENICGNENVLNAVKVVGHIIQIAKWIAPLIIIVLGMVDFGKAVISNDEKALSKASVSLIRRFIAGVVIFFIPTIILAILKYVPTGGIENNTNSTFGACTKCLFDPNGSC